MNRKDFIKSAGIFSLSTGLVPVFASENFKDEFLNQAVFINQEYDVIIIGGSYAGLSAALTLSRALRKVLVIDLNYPRNRFSNNAHNAILIEGQKPSEIYKEVKSQLSIYKPYLDIVNDEAVEVAHKDNKFIVTTKKSAEAIASKLIFATGATDTLPNIKGIQQQWGKTVHHCPYCYGFESKNGRTLLISESFRGLELLPSLKHWCSNLTVCFQGIDNIPEQIKNLLNKNGIQWNNKIIIEIAPKKNKLVEIVYSDQSTENVNHIYLKPITNFQTRLAEKIGCKLNETQRIITDDFMLTNIANVYAIGDISSKSLGQIIWSANSGFLAAVAINRNMVDASFITK
ncbi:MAG: NAD(P)/FAD-dependent oxidoreductase [Chitinophagaceae bacterium]|jgi:thioredoxin reductase|nr:NAD(P)/FAD-dependent oxidoreductase [Chitinophagaceae bacterium]